MPDKRLVLIVDQDKNTVEVELDIHLYRTLGIKGSNIKTHRKRVELNKSVTEFLNKSYKNY